MRNYARNLLIENRIEPGAEIEEKKVDLKKKIQINDLVAGITSDLSNKNQEMHVGILEEIRHNNTSSKTAIIREGNKRTSISLSSLIVLEQKNEKIKKLEEKINLSLWVDLLY